MACNPSSSAMQHRLHGESGKTFLLRRLARDGIGSSLPLQAKIFIFWGKLRPPKKFPPFSLLIWAAFYVVIDFELWRYIPCCSMVTRGPWRRKSLSLSPPRESSKFAIWLIFYYNLLHVPLVLHLFLWKSFSGGYIRILLFVHKNYI